MTYKEYIENIDKMAGRRFDIDVRKANFNQAVRAEEINKPFDLYAGNFSISYDEAELFYDGVINDIELLTYGISLAKENYEKQHKLSNMAQMEKTLDLIDGLSTALRSYSVASVLLNENLAQMKKFYDQIVIAKDSQLTMQIYENASYYLKANALFDVERGKFETFKGETMFSSLSLQIRELEGGDVDPEEEKGDC